MTLLTVKEVAAALRVSPQTVYAMLQRDELPAFRIGSQWRFDSDAFARHIEQRRETRSNA